MGSYWSGRSVLVTGGAGFIGSHLVERLLDQGAQVRVLARYSSTGSWGQLTGLAHHYPQQLEMRLGTISDPHFVRQCCEDIDTVFHLAALIGIPYSYVAPSHYVEVNVSGTLAVLEAARASAVRRLVHTSTSETFGSAQSTPMDEHHPLIAQSPYAATKAAADHLVGSYVRSFGTPAVTLRPFNTFGPRQSTRAVIPTIIRQLLAGPTVRVGATSPIRDMNPVSNTVDGFMLAGETEDVEGELFVTGSGKGRSIGDLIGIIGDLIGVTPRIVTEAERVRPPTSEVEELVCDFSKAKRLLGYVPKVSLEEGLIATINDCRARPEDARSYTI